ncbi:hypothetical protein NRIC_31990 [Enterococcus florum]|uniref:WxL domain-containing protein n=1 Tax=Enterococcus florum TaxID=2480627 RepID=A0A4P5PG94_9ENTE|nr:pectate lyase-like adhesive domain-containing protein [Enterococcus florum]GCF95308.1 hypothetical protein NRIC_31990 [Enterococcus florum]
MKRWIKLIVLGLLITHTSHPSVFAQVTHSSENEEHLTTRTEESSSKSGDAIKDFSYEEKNDWPAESSSDSTKQQPTSESAERSIQEQSLEVQAAGEGTSSNPFRVQNAAELKEALKADFMEGQTTHYIQLINDIVYTDDDTQFEIDKNTVLEGNHHAILYDGTRPASVHFRTGANNLTITFKNITYGNEQYPDSSYYGILQATNSNIDFTVENIQYTIRDGGQPFYANKGAGNKLTLTGTNRFYSEGATGGEFNEGFEDVYFAANSQTSIHNDTSTGSAIFWTNDQRIFVEENAEVDITFSKRYLSYNKLELNVARGGKFTVNGITTSINSATYMTLVRAGDFTMNFAQDSIGRFTTEKGRGLDGRNPIVYANSPYYILFDAGQNPTSIINSINPTFHRIDDDGKDYSIEYLLNQADAVQKTLTNNVTSGQSLEVSNSDIENGQSLLYTRNVSVDDFWGSAQTGDAQSEINTQITQWTLPSLKQLEVNYKLSDRTLYSVEDIYSAEAQESIEQSTENEAGIQEFALQPTEDGARYPAEATQHTFSPLVGGKTYYLYAKASTSGLPGYRLESLWVEKVIEVPAYVNMTFSTDHLRFASPIPGVFGKDQNLETYSVRNLGNVPIALSLNEVITNSSSSSEIALVKQFTLRDQEYKMQLVAENTLTNQKITWGPLIEGEVEEGQKMQIDPYWTPGSQPQLYIEGEYSGPLIGPKDVSYLFKFTYRSIQEDQ